MKRVSDELSERKRAKVEPLGFRRWVLVSTLALQCDVPILEAIHCGMPARLDYVEAATDVLLARGWRQTAIEWHTQIWQAHSAEIHVTPVETRWCGPLARVCNAAGRWFVGNNRPTHSLPDASITSLRAWLQQRLDKATRIV